MKQFNKRKLSVVVALLMCMILAFGSTFAYLTDTTSKINTVTIGKVDIDVVEDLWSQLPDTNSDGIPDIAEAVIPNQTVTKDPSIKNTGNNDAYVYLSVEVPNKYITSFNPDGTKVNGGVAADTDLFSYEINNGWTLIGSKTEAGKTIYTYGYESPLAPGAETPTLFDSVTMVNTNEGQGLEETLQNVIINGYAIQSDNVGDVLNAWNIINNQAGLGTTAITNLLIPGPDFNATIPAAATKIAFVDDIAPAAYSFDNGKLLDVSEAQDKGVVSWYDETNTTYYVSTQRDGLETLANADSSYMFSQKSNLTDIDFTYLDTKLSTNMNCMFYQSKGLSTLNLLNFDTSNVINMEQTFRECKSLTNLDLSNWNTSNVKSFSTIFYDCTSLKNINLGSNFTTKSAENLGWMFMNCSSIETLDLSNFETFNSKMFKSMFNGCKNLKAIDLGENFKTDNAEDMSYMFNNCSSLQSLDVSNFNTSKVENLSHIFQRCSVIKELDVSEWDVSYCKDFSYTFDRCSSLKYVNVSNWNVGKAENLESMFQLCSNLQNLDVSGFDVSSCKDFGFMFYGCSKLISLDFTKWDVRKGESFDHFLAHSKMEEYDVSNWQVTSACTNLNAMFHSTKETYIDVTGWDTSNVIAFNQMFDGMINLEKIDGLEDFDTSSGVCFGEMFNWCEKLKEINLSTFNTRNADQSTVVSGNGSTSYGLYNMFNCCKSLEKIILGENFTFTGNGTLSDSNCAILPTPTSGYWYNVETGQAYAPNEIPDLIAATYASTQP